MIERDFIMRILQQFFEAIAKLIHHTPGVEPDLLKIQEGFNDIYDKFFRCPAEHFYQTSKEDILNEIENEGRSEGDTYAKIQMLSELLYQDALIKSNIPEKCELLEKSLYLLEYLDSSGNTFSWERAWKITDIRKTLSEFISYI